MQKNILALQMKSKMQDKQANFRHVENMLEKFFKENKTAKPDIFFLPELWNISWCPNEFNSLAENENGETVSFLKMLSQKYDMNIIGGSFVRKFEDKFFNSCPVISKNGELVAIYDKIHPFSIDNENKFISKGEKLVIVDLEGFRVGISVCYDIRFPELFRNYMTVENPPHLLVNMAIWPKVRIDSYYFLTHARAIENQAYFLGLSLTGELIQGFEANGHSTLNSFEGDTISSLDDGEDFIYAALDTNKLSKMRGIFPHLKNIQKFDFQNIEVKL